MGLRGHHPISVAAMTAQIIPRAVPRPANHDASPQNEAIDHPTRRAASHVDVSFDDASAMVEQALARGARDEKLDDVQRV